MILMIFTLLPIIIVKSIFSLVLQHTCPIKI